MDTQKAKPLTRYESKCVDCGCVLRGIDSKDPKYCHCGKIFGQNGCIFESKSPDKNNPQEDLF